MANKVNFGPSGPKQNPLAINYRLFEFFNFLNNVFKAIQDKSVFQLQCFRGASCGGIS